MRRPSAVIGTSLRHFGARTGLLAPGRRLVVGFSGGQDSACLLHALSVRASRVGFEVIAAHVDHGLRAESGDAAAQALELARSMGVAGIARRVDVGAYRAGWSPRPSVQQAARAARYQVLARLTVERQADALLLAHTADDQAETLLLNLLRGAGAGGLSGMSPDVAFDAARTGPPLAEPSDGGSGGPLPVRVGRPLLRVERRVTLAYCGEAELPIVLDPSNQSLVYTRNRIRTELMPILERFSPAVRTVLARAAEIVAEEGNALDEIARGRYLAVSLPSIPDEVRFDVEAWRGQSRPLKRRLLRLALQYLLGGVEDVPSSVVEDALDLVDTRGGGKHYDLPRGVVLTTEPGAFALRRTDMSQEQSGNC